MSFKTTAWATHGATILFVLLWGSVAILAGLVLVFRRPAPPGR